MTAIRETMMSDGIRNNDAAGVLDLPADEGDPDHFAHASRPVRNPPAVVPGLCEFAEWLPRLGPVLWLDRRSASGPAAMCPNAGSGPVLLDHPALVSLPTWRSLCAHHAITAHGPREWICFHSASGVVEAKLYLLPDSDVLAWDEMIPGLHMACSGSERNEAPTHTHFLRRALGRFGQRWQAQLLEFRCTRRPWLNVLDAQAPLKISLLGIELARDIMRDENADWISPFRQ
ncbi:MAG: hypothetical protein IPP82_01250 [Xanthomonadales bacterium]|nr:hypothetical protein [Xanthomonadales bacterium]